jgi:hypothetical protein
VPGKLFLKFWWGGGGPEFQDKLRQAGTEAQVWALVLQTRAQEDELLVEHRKERRNQWHEWVTTCFASNQRRLYAWIRDGPKPVRVSPPTQRQDGTWRVGLQGQLEAVEEAWWELWQGKAAPPACSGGSLLPLGSGAGAHQEG